MCAVVLTVTTSTTPERLTAAVPEKPALTPTAARSSLFVAVTLTPRNEAVPAVIVRGPISLASPEGCVPDFTTLCDRPLPSLPSVIGVTTAAGQFVGSPAAPTASQYVAARRMLSELSLIA